MEHNTGRAEYSPYSTKHVALCYGLCKGVILMGNTSLNGKVTITVGYKKKMKYKKILESNGYTFSSFLSILLDEGIQKLINKEQPSIEVAPNSLKLNIDITDEYERTSNKEAYSIQYTLTSKRKKVIACIAKKQHKTPTLVIRQLLILWLRAKQSNKDDAIAKIIPAPTKRDGHDSVISIRINKKAKEEIQNILRPNGYKLAQLITALLDAWIAANKHELPAEETL